jgi:tRNA (mo5U34)-methyltransferase
MRYQCIKLGSFGLEISVGDRLAERIRTNSLYRHFVRPTRAFLARSRNSSEESTSEAVTDVQTSDPEHFRLLYEKPLNAEPQTERTPEQKKILGKISDLEWYHSIDLGHGVVTPGSFEHVPYLSHYHVPEDLTGMRVLDVATFDGFWAFEFEKRGAGEVIGLDVERFGDLDLPRPARAKMPQEALEVKTGRGFQIAREILGSRVRREILNVYDLSIERLGTFDMVFSGDLLLHLMNPMKALQNICSVTSGFAIVVEPYDPKLDDPNPNRCTFQYLGGWHQCIWWMFSLEGLRKMIQDAGFKKVELLDTFQFGIRGRNEKLLWHAVFKGTP